MFEEMQNLPRGAVIALAGIGLIMAYMAAGIARSFRATKRRRARYHDHTGGKK